MRKQPVDNITKEFMSSLRKKLKHHLKKAILFGSRARGTATEASDYDILLIVDEEEPEKQEILEEIALDASVEIMNKYYQMVAFLIYGEHEWQELKNNPLGFNILRDGIEI